MSRTQLKPLPRVLSSAAQASHIPHWYAIHIRHRYEKRAASQLHNKSVETFLPLRAEIHQWSDRRKPVDIPLFPGYAFVRVDRSSSARLGVLNTGGVIGFVTFGSEVFPVPAKQVEDLQRLLSEKVPCSLYPFLKVGKRVRIRGGCLNGLEGILDQRDPKRLVISIDCIERSVAIAIAGYELELV